MIKKSDCVTIEGGSRMGHKGFVIRVAKDGSWADVRWHLNGDSENEYTKRMKTTSLEPLHTIDGGVESL